MKKYFLLAALLATANAQAARLQCDLEPINPKLAALQIFTLEITDERVRVVEGNSGVYDLDHGEGLLITRNHEAGIVATNVNTETAKLLNQADDLWLNRHSLRLGISSWEGKSVSFSKGQCYLSDPKF